ncbi:MAG TPA: TAT-variant-translocated molybdopterin oxidoreductase [Pyrinomonadaceae bacterium]|jgi:molybdopterin-containing oxidoreductase family iron-sulfur binding subunit|nr:TAT-variant-translocated molybdopterin oxidoreductase [Pyrinomonadaceae bacterium]
MATQDSQKNFALLRERILDQQGKEYWRSLEEFVDAPEFEEFVNREFPQHSEEWSDPVSRRSFIKLMGASLALAGVSGCVIQPPEKAIPYVTQPEEYTPGKPDFYATAMTLGGIATGLLVRSNDFRPTKIEGNPQHPGSLGGTDTLAQAAILGMYDPDRSQEITYRGSAQSWEAFVKAFRAELDKERGTNGAGIRFLTETVTSPTLINQFKQILTELPGAKWHQYEPINNDSAMAGAKMALGAPANTVYKFDLAERVLSLDADFMSGFNVRYIKDYSAQRRTSEEKKEMNRLYAVGTTPSITMAKSDHHLSLKPSLMEGFVKAVAKALGVAGAASDYTDNAKWIETMAKDLLEHKGKSIVIAGDQQSPAVHALAHAMNGALGNVGQTVTYTDPLHANPEVLQMDGLRELVRDIDAGAVKMLVIFGGNPMYNTPADLKLTEERIKKVDLRIQLSQYKDETTDLCHWHICEKHFLEMWSDTRAYDGTVTFVQPLIEPLYGGKSTHEMIQLFAKEKFDEKDADILKTAWSTAGSPIAGADFEKSWRRAIHDGFLPNTALPAKTMAAKTDFLSQPAAPSSGGGEVEFVILPDPGIYDGRYANNGWLQELPNPLNKVTWENVALVSPKTAQRLGLNQNRKFNPGTGAEEGTTFIDSTGGNLFSDAMDVTVGGEKIGAPVPAWIMPGQPDDVVTIYLGYGRSRAGKVGNSIGYNVYDVRKSDAMWFSSGAVRRTGNQVRVSSTQTHFNMEGRDILRVFDFETFEKNPAIGHQHDEYDKSMYPRYEYKDHKWGMTIDLNSCVGCNACVVACQSENNIPVVGKEQVGRSREMHWIRIDTYFGGRDANDPEGPHFMPILCQQCEQAPCEPVCPVHATVHSAEGLNDMVYNRCVGTRYCSNNCPYKVRRFNFLLFQDWYTPQYKLMRNPEVTVRGRGVMEKCTYCTQRISAARIESEKKQIRIKDGDIVTACQAACPADAIVFGDINDETSQVAKLKKGHRNYNVLNELNTQPRTTYLASLKNQNHEMPDYRAMTVPAAETVGGTQKEPAGESH